jgi:hypothetical protein
MTSAAPPSAPVETPPRSRLKLALALLVVVTLSLLAALALAELLVRLVAPQQLPNVRPDIWTPDDSLGWVNAANVRTTINTGERTVELATDADGFRVGGAGALAASSQVLFIGDSFVEALQVPYESTAAAHLERALAATLRRGVAVRNAGVDGWEPNAYFIRTRQLVTRRPFGAVIVGLYLGNDLVGTRAARIPARKPAERHALRLPRSLAPREWIDALLYPVNDLLETRSHLFVLTKRRLDVIAMRLGLTAAYFPRELRRALAGAPMWGVTADICASLDSLARANGSRALFVLLPAPHQVDRRVFEDYLRGFAIDPDSVDLEQPNRLLGDALRARGVTVLDVLPDFRAAAARGVVLFGTVDKHLSYEGNALLGRLLEPAVVSLLERPRARPR